MNLKQKKLAYRELVDKRKTFRFQPDLKNPSETAYDVEEIEPWAQWQNNLMAKILVIGQEFCDYTTYTNTGGKVELYPDRYEYPANKNIKEFFDLLEYDIGHPCNPNREAPIFFTNAVMGLKDGTMSANFKDKWLSESRESFLIPLIEIINPNVIITIGAKATKSLSKIYGFKMKSHTNMVNESPIEVGDKKVFPVFHTGGLGLRNRSKALQIEDWKAIKKWL